MTRSHRWEERILGRKNSLHNKSLSANQTPKRKSVGLGMVNKDAKGLIRILLYEYLLRTKENVRKFNSDYYREFWYYIWTFSLNILIDDWHLYPVNPPSI